MLFNFNNYWKNRNYLPASSPREYSIAKYSSAAVFYGGMMPLQTKEDAEVSDTLDQ